MSRCPKCQHDLSIEDLQLSRCPACGHRWEGQHPGDESRPDKPAAPGDSPGDSDVPGDLKGLPQAITGVGIQGSSSTGDPETWNADGEALTYVVDLSPDDLMRMSQIWQTVDDEVPAGMTIKSLESEEVDESGRTADMEELLRDQFAPEENEEAEEAKGSESGEEGSSSVEDTFVSDVFPSAPDGESPEELGDSAQASDEADWSEQEFGKTFLSDDISLDEGGVEASADAEEESRSATPSDSDAGKTSDQTMLFDHLSVESDSQEIVDPAGKTLPLSGEGEWLEDGESKTLPAGPKTTEDSADPLDSSIAKTVLTENLSDEGRTESDSDDGAGRTDRLSSQDLSGAEAAQSSGLVIQLRSLREKGKPQSDEADYELLSLLGEGGMGKVFNARQTSIDRSVAVKMLKPRPSSRRRDQHSKFLAEAVVTGELDHPNIVPIYDVGKDEHDALFYSMKNVTGNPWLDTIHQKSTHDNLEILMSVADAVAFAHARGVVHRDLKPENVMLGEFGEVLVMDWGLAMPTEKFGKQRGIVRSSSMGGTPAYMAPEMATGPIHKIGSHSDIYLLGAILFEIVTGRPPHRGKNAMKCLMAAARNKIVHTDHTGELIEIAFKAMSTNPKDRYKSVQEFQAAVRTYLAHSESITLAAMAEEDLERAQKSDSYEDYSKARFGFEEALKLWDGNKRARDRLGAARLAYAHCALDKGDYDLAASLLDSADRSHDKLKVDIAKACEERDARQKRLEAAKRAGRVMLATLFLVVSGAAFWINSERAAAVESEKNAINARNDAVVAKQEAVAAKDEAVKARELEASLRKQAEDARDREKIAKESEAKQRELAVKRRQEAVAQEIVASLNAIMAEEQADIATKREAEAKAAAAAEALARMDEEKAKLEAISAKNAAEKSADAERRAKEIAEKRRQEAVAQEIVASLNSIMAEEQAEIATKREAEAKASAAAEALARMDEEKAKLEAISAKNAAEKSADAERRAKEIAEQRRKEAVAQEIVASLNAIMAEEQADIAEAAAIAERLAKDKAVEAKIAEEREAYNSKIGLAAAKIEENAFDAARNLLASTSARFRNWEWGYLMRLCEQFERDYKFPDHRLESVALIGDGPLFVVGGENGLAQIRHIDDFEGKDPQALQNVALRNGVQKLPLNPNVTVYDVAVSPDGRWIALATDDIRNGYIKLWNREQNRFEPRRFGPTNVFFDSPEEFDRKLETRHMDRVVSVQFSQDGTKLLTASLDHTARVWNVETGEPMVRLYGHNDFVWDAVFCPNYEKDANGNFVRDQAGQLIPRPETQIVTVSEDGTAIVWRDVKARWQNPENIQTLPTFRAHQAPVYAVACSADGRYIATGGYDRRILLWRPEDIPQIDHLTYIRMSIDGKPIPKTPYRELLGHEASLSSLNFGRPAGEDVRDLVLLSGSNDHAVKVWNVDRDNSQTKVSPLKTFRGHGGWVRDCVWGPGGTWILSVSHDETAKRWSIDKDATSEVHLVDGLPLDVHADNVDAVAFSFTKEARQFATASRDRTAQIYRLDLQDRIQREQKFSEGHDNQIPAGVFFSTGKQLATAGFDNTVRVWDVIEGRQLLTLQGTGRTGALAVSADDQWILSGSDNKQAKIWNAESGEMLTAFGAHSVEVTAVAFGRNSKSNGTLTLATADARGHVFLWQWRPESKAEPAPIANLEIQNSKDHKAHSDRVTALRFLPDGRRLLSASLDTTVAQWDLSTNQEVDRLRLSHRIGNNKTGVTSMDLSEDGRWLVTSALDNVIRLWDMRKAEQDQPVRLLRPQGRAGALMANLQEQFGTKNTKRIPNEKLEEAFRLIAPDADYRQFLDRGGWDQAVEQLIPSSEGKETPRELAEKLAGLIPDVSADNLLLAQTNSVAVSPDGRYIVATNRLDRITHGWRLPANPASSEPAQPFTIDDGLDVWSAAFSPAQTGTELVVLGNSDARQWRLGVQGGKVVLTPSLTLTAQGELASIGFSPDGKYFVTGSAGQDRAARVWSVQTGRDMAKLQGVHKEPINAAVFSPTGPFILTVSNDDPASRDETMVLWKLTANGPDRFQADVLRKFHGHTDDVLDAAFSPDGKWIVSVSRDKTIRLWETETGNEVAKTDEQADAVLSVAFADDGKRILTGSADNQAVIWAVETAKGKTLLKPQLLLTGHSARVTDVAFSPLEDLNGNGKQDDLNGDGKEDEEDEQIALRAVTASADNTVIVWDTRVPSVSELPVPLANQVLTLKRHSRPVNAVRFSPDGRYLLTGSEDRRAILWPTKDWRPKNSRNSKNRPTSNTNSKSRKPISPRRRKRAENNSGQGSEVGGLGEGQ